MLDHKYVSIATIAVVSNIPLSADASSIDYTKSFDLAGISTLTEYNGDIIVGEDSSSGPTNDEKCVAMGYSQTTCSGELCEIASTCQYDSSYVKCGCYCNTAAMCEKEGYVHLDDFVPCVDIPPCQEEEVACPYNNDYLSCKCHCDIEQICSDEGYNVTTCPADKVPVDCPYNNYYKKCI